MNPEAVLNPTAAVFVAAAVISLALVFYTIGVFAERRAGILKLRHLTFFWLGFLCDSAGTTIMTVIANGGAGEGSFWHGATGVLAIALMFFHAVWASIVVWRGNKRWQASFHRLSIGVWLFWLIPYGVGMMIGMPMFQLPDTIAVAIAAGVAFVLGIFFCLKANRVRFAG